MKRNMRLLVNSRVKETLDWPLRPALDVIRADFGLTGTKEGCREGDCGACAVLIGERLADGGFRYRAVPSCLLALAELEERHLITIEGLAEAAQAEPEGLTPVMAAFYAENTSQCGFCSPGFIISLTGWLMMSPVLDIEGAVKAVDGNLCRCTGYGSIRRAAARLVEEFATLPEPGIQRLEALVERRVIPQSVLAFVRKEVLPDGAMADADGRGSGVTQAGPLAGTRPLVLGGGSDWYVRNPEPDEKDEWILAGKLTGSRSITWVGDGPESRRLRIGAAVTVAEFFASPLLREAVPGIEAYETAFASTLVRNVATLGGNVANASPVADMTSMLIGLGAEVEVAPATSLAAGAGEGAVPGARRMPLESLFIGYKKLDCAADELIASFYIDALGTGESFSFEKVAKRQNLDIAAVNSAMRIQVAQGRIVSARISAGGVAATPLLLSGLGAWLEGHSLDTPTVREACQRASGEVTPISDVRGSAAYRSRALGRILLAHFIRLAPGAGFEREVLS